MLFIFVFFVYTIIVFIRLYLLSFFYRKTRFFIISIYHLIADLLFLKRDLEYVISCGDRLYEIMRFPFIRRCTTSFSIPNNIGYCLYDLYFPSPITFSSFKAHPATLLSWLDMGMGGGCFKTIKKEYAKGNLRPRIVELEHTMQHGFINALGLPGPGVDSFIKELNKDVFAVYNRPLGFSIGGSSLKEYQDVFTAFHTHFLKSSFLYYYELNLSCPNTSTGLSLGQDLNQLGILLSFIRNSYQGVLGLKLSPDFSNEHLCQIADLLKDFGLVFLNCGNTSFVKLPYLGVSKDAIFIHQGGVSGEFLFNRTCEIVALLKPFGIPIMATGGISSFKDLETLKNLGASLFGVATALIHDPYQIVSWNYRLK